jgi:hypothetical protein
MTTYNPLSNQFITLSNTMTRNGEQNIRLILDIDNNVFYTLDDNNNFKALQYQPPTLSFFITGNTSATTITSANTWVNFVSSIPPTVQYQSQLNNGLSLNQSTGKIEYSGLSSYFSFIGHIELNAGNNNEIQIALFNNGNLVPGSITNVITSSGGKSTTIPGMAVAQLNSGDVLDIRIMNKTSATNITVTNFNILIKQL